MCTACSRWRKSASGLYCGLSTNIARQNVTGEWGGGGAGDALPLPPPLVANTVHRPCTGMIVRWPNTTFDQQMAFSFHGIFPAICT